MNKAILTLTVSINLFSFFAVASQIAQMPEENDVCPLGLTVPTTAGSQSTFSLIEPWTNQEVSERKSLFKKVVTKVSGLIKNQTYAKWSVASVSLKEEALVKHPKFGAVKYEDGKGGVIFTKHPKGYAGKPLFFDRQLEAWYAPGEEGTLEFPRDRKSKKVIIMYPGEITVAFKIKEEGNLSPSGNYANLNEEQLCNQAMLKIIEREF